MYNLVVLCHVIGMAMLIGGWLANRDRIIPLVLWGARIQLLTGLIIVTFQEMGIGTYAEPDHMKIGVKLLIAVAILGLAETQARKSPPVAKLVITMGVLALLNTAIAVLWAAISVP
ncbi:MAG: hypothetical protein CSB46_08085 [Micrococcales bacterium]|nr:MAG: hypothetical protein CSB46_08085 [Micrococcales bacterium]